MTAREQIQKLTNSWYGFTFLSGLLAFVWVGLNPIKLAIAALFILPAMFIGFCKDWLFGKLLLARSTMTRWFLLLMAGVLTAVSAIAGVSALFDWEIVKAVGYAFYGYMMVRSLRVLTDASVKSYFTTR